MWNPDFSSLHGMANENQLEYWVYWGQGKQLLVRVIKSDDQSRTRAIGIPLKWKELKLLRGSYSLLAYLSFHASHLFQKNNKKSNAIKFHSSFLFQSLALSRRLTKTLSCDGMLRTRWHQYACFEWKTNFSIYWNGKYYLFLLVH